MATKFLDDKWVFDAADGKKRQMPQSIGKAHEFLRSAVEAFPFWKDDLKPRLEGIFERYIGSHAKIELRPDIQALEEWLQQQLSISLATDADSVATPLRNMGDGWQSAIRLATLEALSEYPELTKERVVLLIEEPETHLHPHLRRKLRKVLRDLSSKGWTVVYTTHSPELVSFVDNQASMRLVRSRGTVAGKAVRTDTVLQAAKLQSKIDDRGAHDFLFADCVTFCEGKDDAFALKMAFDKVGLDYDARSSSIAQCGSVTAIPSFTAIASALGIRWCALTDEDRIADGTVKPKTEAARVEIESTRGAADVQVQWPGDVETCLGVTTGKATPEIIASLLETADWRTKYPAFTATIEMIRDWICAPKPA
jgi:predicted ATP-dependent endonuclease of OLD family